MEFGRLRRKLAQDYETEGAIERVRIVFPKGSYAPEFVMAERAFAGSVVVLPFTRKRPSPQQPYNIRESSPGIMHGHVF